MQKAALNWKGSAGWIDMGAENRSAFRGRNGTAYCIILSRKPQSLGYAASFGIVLSTNRKNRVLRAPATEIGLSEATASARVGFRQSICCEGRI